MRRPKKRDGHTSFVSAELCGPRVTKLRGAAPRRQRSSTRAGAVGCLPLSYRSPYLQTVFFVLNNSQFSYYILNSLDSLPCVEFDLSVASHPMVICSHFQSVEGVLCARERTRSLLPLAVGGRCADRKRNLPCPPTSDWEAVTGPVSLIPGAKWHH